MKKKKDNKPINWGKITNINKAKKMKNKEKKSILTLEHISGDFIYIDKNGSKYYDPVLMTDKEIKIALNKSKKKYKPNINTAYRIDEQ